MKPGDACPACGQEEFETLIEGTDRLYGTTTEVFQVVACKSCRLMRLYPQPEPARLRLYYPERYWHVPSGDAVSELTELYRRLVLYDHVWFVERARRDSGETGPVLDVGCGGGLLLRMLHERGLRVLGLDFALSAASAAWRHNAVPAICGTLSQAPLPDASCSVVTMFHVLEHLYDPRAYLDTAHRLLKPGGRLVVQVPNASCWQFLLLGEMWNGLDIPRHLFDFRARDLEVLLESCGFEVVRRKYFSLRDNPAGLVSSLWPGLDPMARLVRGVPEGPRLRLLKNLTYFALTMLATPFTLIEAACRAGSTVMVEARKRA